jgi:hypothetical protein
VTLAAPGDEQIVNTSPPGSATFSPNSGWCYDDNGGTSSRARDRRVRVGRACPGT